MANIVLQTEKLTKRFGRLTAVDNLNLEIHEGEVFGFLGPNGAGKTTSINMMCGLLKPDGGQVFIQGQPVLDRGKRMRARTGVCPQNVILWEKLTCMEQLQFLGEMYGMKRSACRAAGERLLAELGLSDRRNALARTLSSGMRRRLNLALALIHDPEIVILDEPEAGLDPQSRVRVREYIQSLRRNKTVILTTHNMDEADRLADRIAIMDHGCLLVLDTPEALKRRLGTGDVIEIGIRNKDTGDIQSICAQSLKGMRSTVSFDAAMRTLHVRMRNAANHLPVIIASLQDAGLETREINLRTTTLEDVFIQLTGRSLRE